MLRIDESTGEKIVVCAPVFEGHGGIPAGCQAEGEGDGVLWVADMRHGVLRVEVATGAVEKLQVKPNNGEREMQVHQTKY